MKRLLSLGWLAAMAAPPFPESALAQHAEYDALVATHAKANGVPEALVHRVIVRESRYQPGLIGRGCTIGLMQIKLATARGLGYYFAAGYYYVAKRQRLEQGRHPEPVLAAAPSKEPAKETTKQPTKDADASAGQGSK
jgi:hypothetical protein